MAGGLKHDTDKLRYDLIPVRPLAEVARVYTIGAKKYTDRNWELGIEWGRVYAALRRHSEAWWGGERFDPVDGQHHLASVVWTALALMEYEITHPELDDRKRLEKADNGSREEVSVGTPATSSQQRPAPWQLPPSL